MFWQKDKSPKYIPVGRLSDRDLTMISSLTKGVPIVNQYAKDANEQIQGISYTHAAIIFDRANHVVEIKQSGGSREIPTENATVHQSKTAIVFLFEAPLGNSDGHDDRTSTAKVSISPEGRIEHENLFPIDYAGYVGKKYSTDVLF